MRFIENLAPPALLYLLYIVVQIGLDMSLGLFVTAAIKVVMGIAGVFVLDVFCDLDLGVVSWAIVATPFIITALATSISLGIGLDRTITQSVKETFAIEDGDALPDSQDSAY